MKIDLITGFLGSGKTTFLRQYARHLMDEGLRIGILEYDYGAVNVDMLLLGDLRGEQCELEMLAAACDAANLRRRLRTKLISMAMCGYDRVLVEPSGIFDMDDFFDTLRDEPLDRWYEPGSVIAVVNACQDPDLPPQGRFILASEAACAGVILFSRLEQADDSRLDGTLSLMKSAAEEIHCSRTDFELRLLKKRWEEFDTADWQRIETCGYTRCDYLKTIAGKPVTDFDSLYFLEEVHDLDSLKHKIALLFGSDAYGEIFRVKGCLQENGEWVQVNAAGDELLVRPLPAGQNVVIVIGTRLDKPKIEALMRE